MLLETPPQHGKSLSVIDFIAWAVGHDPELRVIYTSFSDRLSIPRDRVLASRAGVRCRVHRRSRAHKWPEATARAFVEQPTLASRLTPKAGWVGINRFGSRVTRQLPA